MFPYLSENGFAKRTFMPAVDVAYVQEAVPGFLKKRIAVRSSYINGRFRKRYGNSQDAQGNSLPMGQVAPLFAATGTNPPGVTLSGRPVAGDLEIIVQITTAGVLGAAVFQWSKDGGTTWTTGVATAASVALPTTGLTAAFAAGTYALDNLYTADTPVPEMVLGWITTLVTDDMFRKRGRDPQDAAMVDLKADIETVLAEIKEAADGETGLFDIPVTESADSAVTTGGPLGYAEQSPYTWTEREACEGAFEDTQGLYSTDLNGGRII
jgi:hypothetical protein